MSKSTTVTVRWELDRAIVLRVGDRFYAHGKKGRLMTAWSLAGAKLFGEWDEDEIRNAEALVVRKGKTSRRQTVVVT